MSSARHFVAVRSSRDFVLYAGLAANVMVAISKLIASFVTGSAGMSSEAVRSFVDRGDEGLLFYGLYR